MIALLKQFTKMSQGMWPRSAATSRASSAQRTKVGYCLSLLRAMVLGACLALLAVPSYGQSPQPVRAAAQININTADAQTLAAGLKGVGLSRAEEIVRHREAFGAFATVEELAEVKGIGESTIAKNRAVITLE